MFRADGTANAESVPQQNPGLATIGSQPWVAKTLPNWSPEFGPESSVVSIDPYPLAWIGFLAESILPPGGENRKVGRAKTADFANRGHTE